MKHLAICLLFAAQPIIAQQPTGYELFMTSLRTGDTEIFATDPITGDTRNITRSPASEDRYAAISADGRRVVFTANRGSNKEHFNGVHYK
jgi:Tol biopolymer transport system component